MTTATDVLTLEESRGAINAQGANATDWLDQWNTAVSAALDGWCGPVIARPVTEVHDGGSTLIVPYANPVGSVTSVTEYQGVTTRVLTVEALGTTQAFGYSFSNGVIYRRAGGYPTQFWPGSQNVVVVLSIGRCADTASVPAVFKTAAQLTLAHLWDLKNGRGDPQFADSDAFTINKFLFPYRVREMLAPYRLTPSIA